MWGEKENYLAKKLKYELKTVSSTSRAISWSSRSNKAKELWGKNQKGKLGNNEIYPLKMRSRVWVFFNLDVLIKIF